MKEIAHLLLIEGYFVKIGKTMNYPYISVITSYNSSLEEIAKEHQLELLETYKIGNNVQGIFKKK